MEEIPESLTNYAKSPADIRELAEAIARDWRFDEAALAGAICSALVMERDRWVIQAEFLDNSTASLAEAVADERERCAKLVKAMLVFADTTSGADEAIPQAIMDPNHWLAKNPERAAELAP